MVIEGENMLATKYLNISSKSHEAFRRSSTINNTRNGNILPRNIQPFPGNSLSCYKADNSGQLRSSHHLGTPNCRDIRHIGAKVSSKRFTARKINTANLWISGTHVKRVDGTTRKWIKQFFYITRQTIALNTSVKSVHKF